MGPHSVAVACGPQPPSPPPPVLPQLVYMGFDAVAADAALRVFRGNVQLAAQTLAHNGGSLPPDLQLVVEDSSSTPSTSPSDSAGGSGVSEDWIGSGSPRAAAGRRRCPPGRRRWAARCGQGGPGGRGSAPSLCGVSPPVLPTQR